MADARAFSTLLSSIATAGPLTFTSALKRKASTKTSTTSIVSTNYRISKRLDALVRLEGRSQAALAFFKFGGIEEESTTDFISLYNDEASSEDEWNAYSNEDADFVDLDIEFGSSNRHSYSSPSQHDDKEDILPLSPVRTHIYSYSVSRALSPVRTPQRRSKTRSDPSFRSLIRPELRAHARTVSMFPSNISPSRKYTSFMDFEHPKSEVRPSLQRLSSLPVNTRENGGMASME